MEKEVKEILNNLIGKKGLMGEVAKKLINDEKKAKQFIWECREQTHNERAKLYWGEALIKQIEQYCKENGRMF
jgi:hypothetical protein